MSQDQAHTARSGDTRPDRAASSNGPPTSSDVADDGQEEVFSRAAVDRGLVKDPEALAPEAREKTPKSPGRLTDGT